MKDNIIENGNIVSMLKMHEVYGINTEDSRYRNKLKVRLEKEFKEQISFFQPDRKCHELVFRSDLLEEVFNSLTDTETCIKNVAAKIRSGIIDHCNRIGSNTWPITLESVMLEYGDPPHLLKLFLSSLLQNSESKKSQFGPNKRIDRLINSFSADLINAISKDKIVTPKHYLVGLGIHNITGQKVPVQVMSRLGHSISYSQVCEIETSLAELALHTQWYQCGFLVFRIFRFFFNF